MIPIYAGSTSQSIDVFIPDSTSAVGAGKTGLAFDTASLSAHYRQGAAGTPTPIVLAPLANAQAAWASGGFVEIDNALQPGMYRLDLPNAAVNAAGLVHLMLKGAAGMAPVLIRIDCRPLPVDVKQFGGTNGTFSGGRPEIIIPDNGITAAKIATAAIEAAKFATDALTAIRANLATDTNVSDAQTAILARLPAALVDGRMNVSVGAMAANVITAAAIQAAALNGKGDWNVGKTNYELTTSQFNALVAAIEVEVLNDATGGAVIQTIANAIAAYFDNAAVDIPPQTIAAAVRTNLATELARLDAAVSTRLASGSYTAPPSAATIASQVRSELTPELNDQDKILSRLGFLMAKELGALANARTLTETFVITVDGTTYTAAFSGVVSTGNHNAAVLTET